MAEDLKSTFEEIGRQCFCLRSRMTARAVTRQYNAALAPVGLEVTEFSLLGALAVAKAPSIAALADLLAFERTTLVRNLKRLADRGLIAPESEKGRAVRYALTKDGLRVVKKAIPLWEAAQKKVTAQLDAAQAGAVMKSLDALRRAAAHGE